MPDEAYDIFISYPHVGNEGDQGITKFHDLLETQLKRRGLTP